MKKLQSLKSSIEFNKIIQKGKKIRSENLFISYTNAKDFKIGISIPKKFGNAVVRNKQKRQLREIISKANIYSLTKHIVLIVKEKWLDLSFIEKEKEFNNLIKKIYEMK